MTTQPSKKRSLSPSLVESSSTAAVAAAQPPSPKRARANNNDNNDLLTELTQVLAEIKSTPSSGEISAELLETFKLLMLQIERLSADETNTEAVQMKHESERCLESWFDDLLARCEADGELDLETLEEQLATAGYDDDDDDGEDDMEAALSLALALEEEEAEEEEAHGVEEHKRQEHQQCGDDEEEEVVVVDEGAEEGRSPAIQQVIA
ncbi:hypothetical protein BDB00DRAFT_868536 [Zychaea mexicana]|uniref:uncharacterized protein n=1 Tax=Zychaea mexicana TaxID=64656 RepID=UPI0022FE3CBB|nr:uncharacterized protein BDB00DRAFT_868536 [Zychaea mexicana]KAI9497502.1 hypothetical protein BDB00DRAFT_868536 [Zychaea mexicana]